MKKTVFLPIVLLFFLFACKSTGNAGLNRMIAGADAELAARLGQVNSGLKAFAEAKKAVDDLTPKDEYYLGRAVAANIAGRYPLYDDPDLQIYLSKICAAIVINSPKPDIYNGYHVAILDTDEINAFATPGGHIFVTLGLVACASSEDALAAVLAHSVASIQLKHGIASIRHDRYTNAAVTAALAASNDARTNELKAMASELFSTIVETKYSQNQILEADITALSLLASAGYQPSGLLEIFRSMKQQSNQNTQPSLDSRIANVNKNLNKYTVADTRSFRENRFSAVPRQN